MKRKRKTKSLHDYAVLNEKQRPPKTPRSSNPAEAVSSGSEIDPEMDAFQSAEDSFQNLDGDDVILMGVPPGEH